MFYFTFNEEWMTFLQYSIFLDAPVYKHTPVIFDPRIWLADKSAILEW